MHPTLDAGVFDEVRMLVCPASRAKGTRVFEDRRISPNDAEAAGSVRPGQVHRPDSGRWDGRRWSTCGDARSWDGAGSYGTRPARQRAPRNRADCRCMGDVRLALIPELADLCAKVGKAAPFPLVHQRLMLYLGISGNQLKGNSKKGPTSGTR